MNVSSATADAPMKVVSADHDSSLHIRWMLASRLKNIEHSAFML